MAMADLALHSIKHPVPLSELSLRQGLSITYLEQLFLKLRRQGLVKSTRGQSGGYELGKEPMEIKIIDIIKAVDEPLHATRCKPQSPLSCQGKSHRCVTHNLWHGLEEQITTYLTSKTLADLR